MASISRKIKTGTALGLSALLLCSCAPCSYDNFTFPEEQPVSTLVPIDDNTRITDYDNDAPYDVTLGCVASSDGLCAIEIKEHYFDITLDLENGDHYSVGKAYGEALLMAFGDRFDIMESYLYENARYFFTEVDESTYVELGRRTTELFGSLNEDYREEINGLCDVVTTGSGFVEDGILTRDELILGQFIPDALRPTACSAVTLGGSRTESGERITSRLLEWPTGTDDQAANFHAVIHYVNGERSFTSVGILGVMTPFSLISDDGVMIAELDVGSSETPFTCEDKTSYTFAMRYAVENFTTAREAAEYMAENAYDFTYCANILVTDEDDAFCVEMSVTPDEGEPIIRDENTPITDLLPYTAEDCLYIVNGFVCEGHEDYVSTFVHNRIRWERFDQWFTGDTVFSMETFKEIMTSERCDEDTPVHIIGNNDTAFHWVIADYGTRTIQASFMTAGATGDAPQVFTVGTF